MSLFTLGSIAAFTGVSALPWIVVIAVAVGGQIGSLLAVRFLPQTAIRWLTAALTIWVGGRLLIGG